MPETARPLRHQPKTYAACLRLAEMAHTLGPEAKLPSALELAAALEVSLGTLNSALNEAERQGLLYRVRGVGIFTAARLSRNISLVCNPTFFRGAGQSPFWELLVERAQERAATGHETCELHFAATTGDLPLQDGLVSDIRAGRTQGIFGVGLDIATADWIDGEGVPFVAFAGPGRYVVGVDGDAVIRQGVAQLAAQGCRKITLWQGVVAWHSHEYELTRATTTRRVFEVALEVAGLKFHPNLVRDNRHLLSAGNAASVPTVQEQGFRTASEVFDGSKKTWPDGIVIIDDLLTHGALLALQKLGVRVGRDTKIASHANRQSPVLMGREDALTLLEFDPAVVVDAMFEMLETLMAGRVPLPATVSIQPQVRGGRG